MFLLGIELYSQAIPPIQVFTEAYLAEGSQHWQITQAKTGEIYFANNKGLLRYDGAQWTLFPTRDKSIMRSVKAIDQRIYSGSYMDFGYWEKTADGSLRYTSLIDRLNINVLEDEQFWNIIPFEEHIVFQSLNRLILVDLKTERVDFIPCENTLLKSFKVDDQLFFQEKGKGLFNIEQGKKVLFNNHPVLKKQIVVQLFKGKEELLALTDKGTFYHLSKQMFRPWAIPTASELEQYTIYSAVKLENEGYALGTIEKGVLILHPDGRVAQRIEQTNGLSNNTVLSLYHDREKNIWLGLDNGVNLINSTSPFKEYQDTFGTLGTVYTSALHEGRLYLGTNQGLFSKVHGTEDKFRRIPGSQGQVWNLKVIDGQLFCGHDRGSFLVIDEIFSPLSSVAGAWLFRQHPDNKDWIVQGNYDGLHLLEKQTTRWAYSRKIKGFDISSRFFEFVDAETLLVSHEYKGVFHLTLNDKFSEVVNTQFDPSVKKGYNSSLAAFDGQIYYRSEEGLFRYDRKKKQFSVATELSLYISGQDYSSGKMINDGKGHLWMFSANRIHLFSKDVFKQSLSHQSIPFDEQNKKSLSGFEHIGALNGSGYLIGGSKGYFTLNTKRLSTLPPIVRLQSITANDQVTPIRLSLKEDIKLPTTYKDIQFNYTAFDYQKYQNVIFQSRLEGYDKEWSEWSSTPQRNYTNLPFGTFKFHLRAKQGAQISDLISSESIKITTPWYLSYTAGVGFSILLFIGFYFYNRYYAQKMIRKEAELIEKNRQAMELRELETQKQLIRLKNEQLERDIESKNRELAVATMSTLKRNEFLNDLKKDLESMPAESKVMHLIKIINAKLNSDDDWHYFEKAFENADNNFFKQLKAVHPNLTNNDLKLCAYLRLNLSSKEIAPLLNISVHSVEIKRYRLRKKMELTRKQNIVEYIMSV